MRSDKKAQNSWGARGRHEGGAGRPAPALAPLPAPGLSTNPRLSEPVRPAGFMTKPWSVRSLASGRLNSFWEVRARDQKFPLPTTVWFPDNQPPAFDHLIDISFDVVERGLF